MAKSRLFNRPIRYRFALLGAVALSCVGLLQFVIVKMENIFPRGTNEKADALYALLPISPSWINGLMAATLVVCAFLCTLRWSERILLALLALCLAFGFYEAALLLILLAPNEALASQQLKTDPPPESSNFILLPTAAVTVLAAGFMVFLLATPFPHQLSWGEGLYMLSTSVVDETILLAVMLVIGLVSLLPRLGQMQGRPSTWCRFGSRLIFGAGIFAGSWWYYNKLMAGFDTQLDFARLPTLLATLTTVLCLFFIDDPARQEGEWLRLDFLHGPLDGSLLWLKILALGLALHEIFHQYKIADQDLPTVFMGDVLNFLTPFVVLIFASALGALYVRLTRRRRRRRHRLAWNILPIALVAVLAIPSFYYATVAWTVAIENNRPLAKHLIGSRNAALRLVGLAKDRPATKKYRLIEERVRQLAADGAAPASSPKLTFAEAKSDKRPPHIFMFVSDATTRLHMGVYGYERNNTPALTQFAKQATVFQSYFSTASDTFQDVLSIFSGGYVGRRALLSNKDRSRLCQLLNRHGYRIYIAGGMKPYNLMADDGDCANAVALSYFGDTVEDWETIRHSLKDHPDEPHFIYVHVHGGHNPWAPAPKARIFGEDRIALYDAALSVSDGQFNDWVANLKSFGIGENVVTIFTADHGIGLGKHLDLGCYSNVYAYNIDVPFVIKVPGVAPGIVKNQVASHIDIIPTLAELLDGQPPLDSAGVSLLGALNGQAAPPADPRCVFSTAAYSNSFSMQCSDGRKFILYRDLETVDVYDLKTDELETHNLVDSLSDEQFLEESAPFARFLAAGAKSYALKAAP